MTRKVIYVSYMRLSDKVSRDWYIDYLIENGINVEYWDVVPLLRGEFDEPSTKATDYLRTFRTYSEVEAMLRRSENKDAFYVMLVNYDGHTARVFRLLSKYDCRMVFIAWGAMPGGYMRRWRRFVNYLSSPLRLAVNIFNKAKAIVYRKLNLVKPFDLVFVAGQVLAATNLYAKKVISINLVDYDHYRKIKMKDDRLVEGSYIVFLDVFLPYHSDYKLAGSQMVNPSEYYAALNRFFELLEVKYKIKVVIAAHPRADYSAEIFNGREIYHGRTPELVKDAVLVIAHHSTALSYAVLNHKPIIFAYTNEMAALYKRSIVSYLYEFSEYLDAAIYNIDEIFQGDQIVIREVNLKSYDNYKYNYLTTHESENITTQEIFLREIRQCH